MDDEEDFEMAEILNKPIFLSIGYTTCHWCHVMERESFEDEIIAGMMNENFVSIKVDREERPDLDQVYMQAVQMLTGSGGWPMTVFLTPEGKPFYGGTYFPPTDRQGIPGFPRLLTSIDTDDDTLTSEPLTCTPSTDDTSTLPPAFTTTSIELTLTSSPADASIRHADDTDTEPDERRPK